MKKIENVFIIEYYELDNTVIQEEFKNCDIYEPSREWLNEIKNDTIYNTYPYEIKRFDFSNLHEINMAYIFVNWFANAKYNYSYFEDHICDEYDFDYKEYSDYSDPIVMLLRWLCTIEDIEEGNYFIRVSW